MARRRVLWVLLGMAALGACTAGDERDAGSAPTRPPPAQGEPATSTTRRPTSTVAPVPATTSVAVTRTTQATGLPAGWSTCTNVERRYSVGYPAGWHTAVGCRHLDPSPLEIPPQTDGFFSAVVVLDGDTLFEETLKRSGDVSSVIVSREQATIRGRRAVRFEIEATGQGYFDKGTRLYSVVIDRSGRSFEVTTAWFPGTSTSEYAGRRAIVDQVAASIAFL